jgi:hypothetical protein
LFRILFEDTVQNFVYTQNPSPRVHLDSKNVSLKLKHFTDIPGKIKPLD